MIALDAPAEYCILDPVDLETIPIVQKNSLSQSINGVLIYENLSKVTSYLNIISTFLYHKFVNYLGN